mgnify:CR=1 FL=1
MLVQLNVESQQVCVHPEKDILERFKESDEYLSEGVGELASDQDWLWRLNSSSSAAWMRSGSASSARFAVVAISSRPPPPFGGSGSGVGCSGEGSSSNTLISKRGSKCRLASWYTVTLASVRPSTRLTGSPQTGVNGYGGQGDVMVLTRIFFPLGRKDRRSLGQSCLIAAARSRGRPRRSGYHPCSEKCKTMADILNNSPPIQTNIYVSNPSGRSTLVFAIRRWKGWGSQCLKPKSRHVFRRLR